MRIRVPHRYIILLAVAVFNFALLMAPLVAQAQNPDSNFSLQVSPSPIIQVVKPGVSQTTELNIRNNGNQTEELKMGLRDFDIDEQTGEVKLKDSPPKEVVNWVTFANPTFTVESGGVFVQKITFNTPVSAGFSYSFAITVSRAKAAAPQPGQRVIEGSVAVFSLLTVDRPGAVRKFDVIEFRSEHRLYEYLPANFTLKLKNTGNVIVQPFGNVYIQRSANSSEPISVLPVNPNGSYILPGVSRSLPITWTDGFPVYVSKQEAANVEAKKHLVWDWSKAQNFRVGRYTAKVVAIYNDGQRDVPIMTSVSFWIIPWKALLIIVGILALLIIGISSTGRKLLTATRRKKHHEHPKPEPNADD